MKKLQPRVWRIVATEGDFTTESTKSVSIPGTRLEFELPEPTLVFFTLQAAAAYWPARVGLRIDEHILAFMLLQNHEGALGTAIHHATTQFETQQFVSAGHHAVEVIASAIAKGPQGPKEWSPRIKKGKTKACIMRNPSLPLVLMVRAVA